MDREIVKSWNDLKKIWFVLFMLLTVVISVGVGIVGPIYVLYVFTSSMPLWIQIPAYLGWILFISLPSLIFGFRYFAKFADYVCKKMNIDG